jgi:hypothetical protein
MGRGTFGKVKLATHTSTNEKVRSKRDTLLVSVVFVIHYI